MATGDRLAKTASADRHGRRSCVEMEMRPDRPSGDERGDKQPEEKMVAFEDRRGDAGMSEGCDSAEEEAEDQVRNEKGGQERGQAFPTRNSSEWMGGVSTGSNVPCSRSPTTEYERQE